MACMECLSYGTRSDQAPRWRTPNAAAQARQTAGARHERTLFAVACSRLFGKALASWEPAPGVPSNAYLMTSSARLRRDGGIVISSAWAVVRVLWPRVRKWRADSLGILSRSAAATARWSIKTPSVGGPHRLAPALPDCSCRATITPWPRCRPRAPAGADADSHWASGHYGCPNPAWRCRAG